MKNQSPNGSIAYAAEKLLSGGRGRIVVSVLLCVLPIGFAYAFIYFVLDPILHRFEDQPYTVAVILEEIPKESRIYVFVAALFGACLGWRWWMLANLRKKFEEQKNADDTESLTACDWDVAEGLRQRALALRTRADLLLGAGLALLIAGVYSVLFIVPEVAGTDPNRIEKALFVDRFASRLECTFGGRCWVKTELDLLKDSERSILDRASKNNKFDVENVLVVEVLEFPIGDRETPIGDNAARRVAWLVVWRGEWVSKLAFSADGTTGIVAGTEVLASTTTDGGKSWSPMKVELKLAERISAVALSANGKVAIVAGTRGSAFWTTDGGDSWRSTNLELKSGERVTTVALSANGRVALVAGTEGSASMTSDGGMSWRRVNLELKPEEWISVAALSVDGTTGIVASNFGSVSITSDGGEQWLPMNADLWRGELLGPAAFSSDGTTGIAVNIGGEGYMTTDGGRSWQVPRVVLASRERIAATAFSADGRTGIVAGNQGSVAITIDRGENWLPANVDLKAGERIVAAALDADGTTGIVVGIDVSVSITNDHGKSWHPTDARLGREESVSAAAFNADGTIAIVAGDYGSVSVTTDGGKSWRSTDVDLTPSGQVAGAALSADGTTGILAGDYGSVFTTTDSGRNWRPTNVNLGARERIKIVALSGDGTTGLMTSHDDSVFILKSYPGMAGWNRWSPEEIRREMAKNNILESSEIFSQIGEFVDSMPRSYRNRGDEGTISRILGEVNVVRGVTLAVVFFLVHILVRLYQYSLRLAAFWDSRADAVLLARSFSNDGAARFDDLVGALAPDAYDFKPPPKSPFDWFRARRDP